MSITVKRAVRVMVVVTDQFKERRMAEIRSAMAKLEVVGRRIESELSSETQGEPAVTERLTAEKRRNMRAGAALRRELERVVSAKPGTLHDRGTLEGMVEVEVGDDISRISDCQIVVQDGKIVEIRDGACQEPNETSL